ncbi:MAG: hypothetical protein QXW98_04625 [Candidatus Caldarchaeum sp.]
MPNIYPIQPTTVTVDWGSTGDKTLLQITDNLPAGEKIVLFVLGFDPSTQVGTDGYLRIVHGSNTLVQEGITRRLNGGGNRAKPAMLFAYLPAAPANAQFTFICTTTTTASGSSTLHVQGMVILLEGGEAFFSTGLNTNIAAGATVNLATVNTNFPEGSKVAVLAYVQMGRVSGTGHLLYQAGNIRILKGSSIVSQNQFRGGTYMNTEPAMVSLSYLDTSVSSNPSYSIQVYNSLSVTSQAWGEIIAFRVGDGAFLDTASVGLTNGSQLTVGNLSTSLSGEVGVIALAAAEYTGGSSAVTAFNAGDVVLQLDNQETGQVANQRGWILEYTGWHSRTGVYALFRADTGVSNPSYQVKMTARADGINGEAKILAFVITTPTTIISISDSGVGMEAVNVNVQVLDSGTGVDSPSLTVNLPVGDSGVGSDMFNAGVLAGESGAGTESVSTGVLQSDIGVGSDAVLIGILQGDSGAGAESVSVGALQSDSGTGTDDITAGQSTYIGDAGSGSDSVDMTGSVYVSDSGVGAEVAGVQASISIHDSGYSGDTSVVILPQTDTGTGDEVASSSVAAIFTDVGVGIDTGMSEGLIPVSDAGAGVETINSPKFNIITDTGSGLETIRNILPMTDSGIGVEVTDMLKEVIDTGAGSETASVISHTYAMDNGTGIDTASVISQLYVMDYGVGFEAVRSAIIIADSGMGSDVAAMMQKLGINDSGVSADTIGVMGGGVVFDYGTGSESIDLVAYTSIADTGLGADLVELLYSMFGSVMIEVEPVGVHSIPYKDLVRDDLPIQTQRRVVTDSVWIGDDEVGYAEIEWEDKVTDISSGFRRVIITGLVRIVD